MGGVLTSILVDSGTAITTIRKSDAEGMRQFSNTAIFEDKEFLTNRTGLNKFGIPSLGKITAELEFGKWKLSNCSLLIVPENQFSLPGRDKFLGLGLQMQQLDPNLHKDLSQLFSKCVYNVTPFLILNKLK